MALVTLDQFRQARARIQGVAARTPLVPHRRGGPELYFKPESFQPIGSFKLRGAYNKIASLADEQRRRGVITYSSGNHAQGVAYAARALGIHAVIVMPASAPRSKLEATAALGAEILPVGPASSERQARAEALASEHGYIIIPPFDDEQIIAGQGTIGLEIADDLPNADLVLVPVGGGGLISGIAAALKLSSPKVRIVGVEPELANDAQQSFRSGGIVTLPAQQVARTAADGLRTQHIGETNFEHIRRYVDDIVTVSEDQIRLAMRRLALEAHLVAEPSGAVTYAAWLFRHGELPAAQHTVAVISGGNVEPQVLAEALNAAHLEPAMKLT
jgi:threonine dehydratase